LYLWKLHADDIKLHSVINPADDLHALIQVKINKLGGWSSIWQLKISHGNCCATLIRETECDRELKLNDVPTEIVNECRDDVGVKWPILSIYRSYTLPFASHINNIVAKTSTRELI
jgi:hypothetical protein